MFLNGITPPCYIEVYLPRQEIQLACVCEEFRIVIWRFKSTGE